MHAVVSRKCHLSELLQHSPLSSYFRLAFSFGHQLLAISFISFYVASSQTEFDFNGAFRFFSFLIFASFHIALSTTHRQIAKAASASLIPTGAALLLVFPRIGYIQSPPSLPRMASHAAASVVLNALLYFPDISYRGRIFLPKAAIT